MFLIIHRTRNKEIVELRTYNQSDIYEIIDKEHDKWRGETSSEIKSPHIAYIANTQDNVEGLALNHCPAYLSPSATRGEEDVEDRRNGVFEAVNPIYC